MHFIDQTVELRQMKSVSTRSSTQSKYRGVFGHSEILIFFDKYCLTVDRVFPIVG